MSITKAFILKRHACFSPAFLFSGLNPGMNCQITQNLPLASFQAPELSATPPIAALAPLNPSTFKNQ
jgi:hypothetical protein